MNGVLIVFITFSATIIVLRGIRDCRRRPENTPLPPWEEDRIRRLREREIDESSRIGWRRG